MEVKCPRCSGLFDVPETVATTTCPYCSLTFRTGVEAEAEAVEEDHYYFPASPADPMDMLLRFVMRQVGVPRDLRENAVVLKRELHYVPVYFAHVEGRARVTASSGRATIVEEVDDVGVVAAEKFAGLLEDYRFPMRGKRFYEERVRRLGIYHEPALGSKTGMDLAAEELRGALTHEASECCRFSSGFNIEEFKVEYRGLVHYPIWALSYQYRGEVYPGYLDGADGKVIAIEHPLSFEARTLQVSTAAVFIVTGLAIGLTLAFLTPLTIIGALIPCVASAIPLLTRGVSRRVKVSEVKEFKEKTEPISVEKAFKALTGLRLPVRPFPDMQPGGI